MNSEMAYSQSLVSPDFLLNQLVSIPCSFQYYREHKNIYRSLERKKLLSAPRFVVISEVKCTPVLQVERLNVLYWIKINFRQMYN